MLTVVAVGVGSFVLGFVCAMWIFRDAVLPPPW